MIVVTEHRGGDDFLDLARSLLEALAAAEGFLDGRVGRSPDDPQVWTIVTSWRDVGSMRRGFGSFDAKVAAAPVMVSAVDRVSAFEVMLESTEGGVEVRSSDRSQD
ncbi:MAG: antibiotic biosynthesis monooxygenase [Actinobacteria bacterium]|jgi:quinol monooxygenase YgiN|nr:antibiotic biosynthesis monooxygenase [Micrococcales bacterium]MCB0904640.1 antibiotic biosynthesis monooxygenase [Actinomycetota bacterium]MCO5299199.1 antibiotic biosynthesis monooxygenase [Candidatus Nanopelagicales bacterium]MCB9429511.1 antibiotic biosynthesis monooxygenase [Actinomycetota bacterium]HPE11688.1 antibiotic biosynthesis monooxygenase [Actinomycetota bacterium]